MNDNEPAIAPRRERTLSDNWANNLLNDYQTNEIKEELNKPTTHQVTSFTENMVYTQPVTDKVKK